MINNQFDIRLLKVSELNSKSKFNRWEIMRYKGIPLNVSLSASITPMLDENILKLELGVHYILDKDGKKTPYVDYYICCEYEIPNLVSQIETNDLTITLPSYMITIMMSVAVGTLRGMLVKKLENTKLGAYPLPIINVSEIIHECIFQEYL